MCENIFIKGFLLSLMLVISTSVSAVQFNVEGKILRTLTEGTKFGKCMVLLDTNIGNNCPASNWVSLDCQNTYYPAGDGDRMFSTALTAAISGKTVVIRVDDTKKHTSFCTAQRLDVIM